MFGHDVYLTILSRHFDSIIFAGVMGLSLWMQFQYSYTLWMQLLWACWYKSFHI
jgi:hypothetical protein